MGPVALFDKSFLHGLSPDESVWFDHFFLPVICPVFYIETLADLSKEAKPGRSSRAPEDVVRILAGKSPVLSGAPCAHHVDLCISNLLGQPAPHLGQVPIAGGRPARTAAGKPAISFRRSPEAEAFWRWQHGEFEAIERDQASDWRRMLSELDLQAVGRGMQALGITPKTCRTVEHAHGIAASLVHQQAAPDRQLDLLFAFVNIPAGLRGPIAQRWADSGYPPLAQHAPYAAHVLKVELFFQIGVGAGLIAATRASNRADIAYLFYVPFCHLFVSNDKLHQRCTLPFLSKKQDFVWAEDLKADLAQINEFFLATSLAEREQGLHKLAPRPPDRAGSLAAQLWKKHCRAPVEASTLQESMPDAAHQRVLAEVRELQRAPTASEVAHLPSEQIEALTIERAVPPKKGSWWLIPKAVADAERQQGLDREDQ